jgi:FkbM family methyltransferase
MSESKITVPTIDYVRRLCGHRFPPVGKLGYELIMSSLPREIKTELFPGIAATLDLNDDVQRWTYWYGTRYEAPTPEILTRWGKRAREFFDIGANYGFFTFLIRSFCPNIQIHSFEPNPRTFSQLEGILQLNHLDKIHLHPIGLSDVDGTFPFYPLELNSGHSAFSPVSERTPIDGGRSNSPVHHARTRRFDDFMIDIGLTMPTEPSWIAKIDVEGYEMKTLLGMERSLQNRAFLGLCIELLDENLALEGARTNDIEDFMENMGYSRLEIARPRRLQHNAFFVPAGAA